MSYRQQDGTYRYGLIKNRFTDREFRQEARGRTGYFLYLAKNEDGTVLWGAYCHVPQTLKAVDRALARLGTSRAQLRARRERADAILEASAFPSMRSIRDATGFFFALLLQADQESVDCPDGEVAGYDEYSDQWGCYEPPELDPIVTGGGGSEEPPPPDDPWVPPPDGNDDPSGGGGGTPSQPPGEQQGEDLCGDERDYIMDEYLEYGVNFYPSCLTFNYRDLDRSVYFSWTELTWQSPSLGANYHDWAILRLPLLASAGTGVGLDKWREAYGGPRIINSGWRCPQNNALAGGASQSRHMYGDAVDLRNQSYSLAEWQAMEYAARVDARATWTEPQSGPCGLGCVHADWRGY